MIKEFMDKLNDVESSGVDLGVMEIDKGKKEKAPKAENEADEGSNEEDEGSEDDIKTEIFKKALEMAGYESDDSSVEALISDLASNGMEIEIGEEADKDEIIKTLSDYISGIENDDEEETEESEENKEHEDSETAEEEKEEHMEESAKTNKKIIKENTMEIGIKQIDKLSRGLGMMSGLIDGIKDEKTKEKFNKIYSDLDSIITDLSAEDDLATDLPMDMPADEELPVEPEVVTEPTDDEVSMEPEATEEIPAVEDEEEAPVATESIRHKKLSTISESASAYLSKLDWITD